MATHERELTDEVDLCRSDGATLADDAIGWSRTPLHTANLKGRWGRNKRWDYWCVLAPDLAVAITYADVDYLGMATIWWVDLSTGETGGCEPALPLGRGVSLPDRPGSVPLRYRGRRSSVELIDDAGGTTFDATWTEPDGRAGRLALRVELPDGHESVNVVIPRSKRQFQFTSKQQARPAHGTLDVGERTWTIGTEPGSAPDPTTEAWGVLDVGRGRWPYRTTWNWGGGAGRSSEGAVLGLQFGAKWTEGTGFTENGVIVDGRVTKIGEELIWAYEWDHPLHPWRVHHPDGSLDVTLSPTFDRHTKVNALLLASEVHQAFGTWSGHVTSDDGQRHQFEHLVGFAEESRSRW